MANPEMMALNNTWMPVAMAVLVLAGLLIALKLTARPDSNGDKS